MRYLIFNTEKEYTDDEGNPCSLEEHLIYLSLYDGTPDMWHATDDLVDAIEQAQEQHFDTIIYDELHDEVIHKFKKGHSDEDVFENFIQTIQVDPHYCTREEYQELIDYLDENCWDYKTIKKGDTDATT